MITSTSPSMYWSGVITPPYIYLSFIILSIWAAKLLQIRQLYKLLRRKTSLFSAFLRRIGSIIHEITSIHSNWHKPLYIVCMPYTIHLIWVALSLHYKDSYCDIERIASMELSLQQLWNCQKLTCLIFTIGYRSILTRLCMCIRKLWTEIQKLCTAIQSFRTKG